MRETFLFGVVSFTIVASLLALAASTKARAPDKIALCQSVVAPQLRASCKRNLRREKPQKTHPSLGAYGALMTPISEVSYGPGKAMMYAQHAATGPGRDVRGSPVSGHHSGLSCSTAKCQ